MSKKNQKLVWVIRLSEKMQPLPDAEPIRQNTQQLFDRMIDEKRPLTRVEETQFLQFIAEGKIDADAYVHTESALAMGFNMPSALMNRLVEFGRPEGVAVFRALLDRASNLNHDNIGYSIQAKLSHHPDSPYYDVTVSHPRVDLNHPRDVIGNSLLSHDMSFVDLPKIGKERQALHRQRVCQMLDHGALMHHMYHWPMFDHLRGADWLKPYYDEWNQLWQNFDSGTLKPEELTATMLGRFYSLGKLEQALEPARWQGHEAIALSLYECLPKVVQERHPCHAQRAVLSIYCKPEPQIQGWSIGHEAFLAEQPAVSASFGEKSR